MGTTGTKMTHQPSSDSIIGSVVRIMTTFLILLALAPVLALADSTAVVTIKNTPSYQAQRACVQNCLWHSGSTDDLLPAIGCTAPWLEVCMCRVDLASSASSFLASCVNKACNTAPVDVANAVSLYNSYCSRDNVATTTLGGTSTTPTVLVITTVFSNPEAANPATSQTTSESLLVLAVLLHAGLLAIPLLDRQFR